MHDARILTKVAYVLYDRDVINQPDEGAARVLCLFTDEQTAYAALLRHRAVTPRAQLVIYRSRTEQGIDLAQFSMVEGARS